MNLTVQSASFRYRRDERFILRDLSFSLQSGEVLAILGPNGAGKTTLLRCMMGLLPWEDGATLLDGRPLSSIARKTLWRQISYVPQAKRKEASYTVGEMVLLGRASMVDPFALPGKEDIEAVDLALERTNLSTIRDRSCAELSGGEMQMVLIARALASEPRLIIFDEPESNLDLPNQLLVLDRISALSAEGITCIFNTHYPAHALRHADKALMLSKDSSYLFGEAKSVVTEDNILRFFGVRTIIGSLERDGAAYADIIPIAINAPAPDLSPNS